MLNLGILAHVDAGKTSLTERLLYHAGVIPAVGSVDAGSTQTDSLAMERQRGITIRSAVVSFTIGDVAVNLIDTPGHPDFIAEVERVLAVLDGAVLVISAVEGIQAQTRVLMRTLRRLGLPTLLFVNKIDRGDARYGPLLAQLASRLTPAVVAMGGVSGLGSRTADFTPFGAGDGGFTGQLALTLAIAKQPELLVLDEPAASLDPLARRELLRNLMEAVAAQGTSVLLSSHLVADLERVCDYLVVLVASQVRLAGDVGALLESHHRLSGPRRDAATLPGDQEVIEESHIGKQSTFLVRSSGPVHDPAWTVRPVSLEDLVLAYLGRAAAPGQAQQPGLAVVS